MFPLIGSFVKERRGPVLLWQWLITIISCLSIFDKPTVTQQHGCLSAFAHSGSTSLFSQVSLAADLPQFPLTTRCYIYSYSNRHSIFSCLLRKFLYTITTNLLPHNLFSLQPLWIPFLSAAVTNCQVMQSITSTSSHVNLQLTNMLSHQILRVPRGKNSPLLSTIFAFLWIIACKFTLVGNQGSWNISVVPSKSYYMQLEALWTGVCVLDAHLFDGC